MLRTRFVKRYQNIFVVVLLSGLALFLVQRQSHKNLIGDVPSKFQFEGFDNEKGSDELIVPNIVHYIRYNKPELDFFE